MRAPTTVAPGGGMHAGVAEIGTARGVGGDVGADAFELSAANVFQILALGSGGGGFVEIDGDLIPLPDFFADMARHGYAIFDGDAVDGDERHDVGRAHAGMRALVEVEVD